MEERNNSFLANEKIGKLMRGYAIPCIISLLVGALYNIVDQIFIANASYLGSFGNAANTVVFPLTVIVILLQKMVKSRLLKQKIQHKVQSTKTLQSLITKKKL